MVMSGWSSGPSLNPNYQDFKELVKEQLDLGHLEQSTRKHNTPIFVIQKKSGHYQLLQDLCAINDQMEMMGTTQAGLLHPSAIPSSYHTVVLDVKDCFFQIPLALSDLETHT